MNVSPRCVIVGAGLGGLVTAHALRSAGLAVTVLEAEPQAGGKLRTFNHDGYLVERGPQSFLYEADSAFTRAIEWAGLTDAIVDPGKAGKKRFVLRRKRLWKMPSQVARILSVRGLLSAGLEPLRPRGRPKECAQETVHAFAARRFGDEVARVLFGALISGIFAGDTERLEVASAFPRMLQLERDCGSLVRAMLSGGFKPRGMRGLRAGMGSLAEALATALGDDLVLATPASRLVPPVSAPADGAPRWSVEAGDEAYPAEAVVLASPASVTAKLLEPVDRELSGRVAEIPYASLAAVALGYDASAFRQAPEGFGFLVPRLEGLRILGCLFPSSVFPQAAPQGKVLLRVMIGGRLDPEAVTLSEQALVDAVRREVEPLLGVTAPPQMTHVLRHEQAIPQYELGHAARVNAIEAALAAHPGLYLTGNPYRGISLGDTAADAERTAAAVASLFQSQMADTT